MGNAVIYFEIGAADNEQLKQFYTDLFGWHLEPIPPGGYSMVDTRAGSGVGGGIGRSRDGTPWATFYVETDDPQSTLDKAESLGGKTIVPVSVIPDIVTWAMFSDPDGSLVGLYKPAPGSLRAPSAGDGAAIDWFEVLGADAKQTWTFYSELFGWQAAGAGPYWLVDTGAKRGINGGVGGGSASKWATVYAHVPNVDTVLARAEQLGGKR